MPMGRYVRVPAERLGLRQRRRIVERIRRTIGAVLAGAILLVAGAALAATAASESLLPSTWSGVPPDTTTTTASTTDGSDATTGETTTTADTSTTSTTATSTASTTTTTAVTTTTGTTPTTTAAPPPTPQPPAAGRPGGVSGKTSPGLLGEAQGAEAETAAAPTIWLPGFVVDPTPPARRLAPAFARSLRSISARQHVPWWDVLGYL